MKTTIEKGSLLPKLSGGARAQHWIDLENLLSGRVTAERAQKALRLYSRLVPIGPRDDVVVALGPNTAQLAAFALPSTARLLVGKGSGANSADKALVESIDPGFTASKFSKVFIASGDHFFAPLAKDVKRLGLQVVVVYVPSQISHVLYRVADSCIRFETKDYLKLAA